MTKAKGNIFIISGLLLLAAALCLAGYNRWDSKRAEKASDEIVEKLAGTVYDHVSYGDPTGYSINREMPTEEIDGYDYIGIIEIPSLGLSLPVMAEWDYTRLKISPCRYTGSYYTDDMVVCAHNYAKHFSHIKWIEMGAEVYFTNVEGELFRYTVSNRETVQPTAVGDMIDSDGDWDLTLFTCNTGGRTRCAVRCIRITD